MNIVDIILIIIIAIVLILAVRKIYLNKKSGKICPSCFKYLSHMIAARPT